MSAIVIIESLFELIVLDGRASVSATATEAAAAATVCTCLFVDAVAIVLLDARMRYSPSTAIRTRLDDGLSRLSVDGKIVNGASLDHLGCTKKRGSSLGSQDRRSGLRSAGSDKMNHHGLP